MEFFKNNLTQISLKTFTAASLTAAVVLVSGCSSDDPDQGSALSTTPISGVAIDGYLAGTTVYLDFNDNGERNAGEPFAITDKDGFFSTAKDLTDYCASDATVAQARHCLRATELGAEVVLRTFGGFDLFTGEPFDGSLSTRVTVENATVANEIISPISSMLTDVRDAAQRQNILDAYGLAESDLDRDFLNSAGFDATTTNAAIAFHKVVTLFANIFDEHYEAIGIESGFPDNSNGLIYKALADAMGVSKLNDTSLAVAYAAAESTIRALYDDADQEVPFNHAPNQAATLSNAGILVGLVDNALPVSTSFDDAKSRVTAVEMVVKKMIEGDPDAVAALVEASNISSDLYVALDAAMDIDFSALVDVNYFSPNYAEVDITGATPLTALAEKQLFIAHAQDTDGVSGSAHFFFDSDELGTSGTLDVCLKYQVNDEERVEETEGTLVNGTWFALDDNRLILTLEGFIDIALINKGLDSGNAKYSLSYGGETLSWLSNNSTGLLGAGDSGFELEQPTTNEGCVSLLTPQS